MVICSFQVKTQILKQKQTNKKVGVVMMFSRTKQIERELSIKLQKWPQQPLAEKYCGEKTVDKNIA